MPRCVRRGESFGRHTVYADGEHRPFFRGVLHGIATVAVVLWLLLFRPEIRPEVLPVFSAIVWTLVCSSTLHLIPYANLPTETIVNRLDKCGIVAVCCMTFITPALTSKPECNPPLAATLFAAVLPNGASAAAILAGDKSPRVFVGLVVCCCTMGVFVATISWDMAFYIVTTFSLYAGSMYLFVARPGGKARWWGYHEWMHVMVTLSFYYNYVGVDRMVEECSVSPG